MRVIFQHEENRIIENEDENFNMDDLKGDCYCPKTNSDIPAELLKNQENAFELFVHEHGVYGYELQRWDSAIGAGWTHIDSCHGFIGKYNPENTVFNHYIVDELKQRGYDD